MIHYPVRSAIAELSLLAVTATGEEALTQFHREALHLRDLLKFEFFFEGREEFIRSLEKELDLRSPEWRNMAARGEAAARELVSSLPVILGHGTLRAFLEAYLLVAEALSLLPHTTAVDSKMLLARSHALGRQRLLQHRIHCEESVSSSYFENAIKIAESRDLLDRGAGAKWTPAIAAGADPPCREPISCFSCRVASLRRGRICNDDIAPVRAGT
jgi:glycerol-3-phosphate O-acyltransferase